jgi:HEAT repeat protein
LLAAIPGDESVRALLDISMFGFAYASGASLHYLEKRGTEVVPHIRQALVENRQFDPIKTGMVSVLGNLGGPEAYALLIELLDHESPHLVNWAGDALGKFNNPQALPAMTAASERIGGQPMIDAAIEHLRDLA